MPRIQKMLVELDFLQFDFFLTHPNDLTFANGITAYLLSIVAVNCFSGLW